MPGCGCEQSRGGDRWAHRNHRISDSLSLRNAFRYYDYSLERSNTLVGSVNEKAMTASLTRGDLQRDESGFFNQTELTQKLELAGMKHQLLYGFEFGRQSKELISYSRANVATVSLLNPVLPTLPRRIDGKPSADNQSVFKVASVYQVTWSPLPHSGRLWRACVTTVSSRTRMSASPASRIWVARTQPGARASVCLSAIVCVVLLCFVEQVLPASG